MGPLGIEVETRNQAGVVVNRQAFKNTVLGTPLIPVDEKVVKSVSRRLENENLDLDRYYYSSDLSTRLKKNPLNALRVAVVNFFTGGRYELKALVNNVNATCFYYTNQDQAWSWSRIGTLNAKLEKKRPDLGLPSINNADTLMRKGFADFSQTDAICNQPQKSRRKEIEDGILYDFLFNMRYTRPNAPSRPLPTSQPAVGHVQPAPSSPVSQPAVESRSMATALTTPAVLPTAVSLPAELVPEPAQEPTQATTHLTSGSSAPLPTAQSMFQALRIKPAAQGSVDAAAQERRERKARRANEKRQAKANRLAEEQRNVQAAYEGLDAITKGIDKNASSVAENLSNLIIQNPDAVESADSIISQAKTAVETITTHRRALSDFAKRHPEYANQIQTTVGSLVELSDSLHTRRLEAVGVLESLKPQESNGLFAAFTNLFD